MNFKLPWPYIWLLVTIFIISFAETVYATDPPLPIDQYWQKVEDTRDLITGLDFSAETETSQTQLQTLATEWEQITAVTLSDQTELAVDHSYLVAQLRTDSPNETRLVALLDTLLAVRQSWPAAKHSSQDVIALTDILARAEFQWQPEQPSLLAQLWREILRYLLDLLPEEAIVSLDGVWLSYVLTVVGMLVMLGVMAYLLSGLFVDFAAQAEFDPEKEAGDEILTADLALKQAQTLSSQGDYRTAVRYLYLSSLLLLDERGLLRYDRARTNYEYLRSIAHLPHLAAILQDVIEIFDRVWYGYQKLDETSYAHYAALVAELRRQR